MATDKLTTTDQYPDTPAGWSARWEVEMTAAEKDIEKWKKDGEDVVRRFLDDRSAGRRNEVDGDTRVNLFTANVQTLQALLYGNTPKVDVKRRFADPGDDIARIGGEILQRLLNTDIERDSDTYALALEQALSDRLLPGLGAVRVRYEAEFEEQEEVPAILHPETGQELAPAYKPEDVKTYECVETDYVHWQDLRWSPARTWDDVRWIAFRALMTREALIARFGERLGKLCPLNAKEHNIPEHDGDKHNPWARAEVWEIWHKEDRKVYWYVKGFNECLDIKEDILGLDGFWPMPRPMIANATTSKLIPRPDFIIAMDLYNEVDNVSSRITNLERAVAVRGVYDKTSEEVKRLLSEAISNDMIPVDNWAAFAEKGGLQGAVSWMPIDVVVATLDKLREYRTELMALLYQVTGMSDIMRGQSSGQTTATEQSIKAKFAGVRVQRFQQEFARFASETQALKAEIISKHFDPQTIVETSGVQYMMEADAPKTQAAVALIKSNFYQYRIDVKPEAISMTDYSAVKQERGEFLMSVATFLQSGMPVMQAMPFITPHLFQMLQWAMAGFRDSATIEGVLDQAVMSVNQALEAQKNAPPKPDPEMMKAQLEMEQMKQQGQMDMMKTQTDLAVHKQKAQVDVLKTQMDLKAKQQEHALNAQAQQRQQAMDERKANLSARQMELKARADAMKTVDSVTRSPKEAQ